TLVERQHTLTRVSQKTSEPFSQIIVLNRELPRRLAHVCYRVRRIRKDHIAHTTRHEFPKTFRIYGVAAEQAVCCAKDPEVARPGDRRCRHLRSSIFVGQPRAG